MKNGDQTLLRQPIQSVRMVLERPSAAHFDALDDWLKTALDIDPAPFVCYIPRTAMTELEWRVLRDMFEHEEVGEDIYFFASHGPNDFVFLEIVEVRRLLGESDGIASSVADLVRKEIGTCDPDAAELELDLSVMGFESIFQDIIRRSALDHVEVETAMALIGLLAVALGVPALQWDPELAAAAPDVRLVDQRGPALADAYNTGIAEAQGTHVAFLAHDDMWLPSKVEVQLARLAAQPPADALSLIHISEPTRPY